MPFNIGFSVGNFGGNASNTTYVVNGSGQVVVSAPGSCPITAPVGTCNTPTGNLTFLVEVPEPGALSLAALALIGAGVVTRRKARQAA